MLVYTSTEALNDPFYIFVCNIIHIKYFNILFTRDFNYLNDLYKLFIHLLNFYTCSIAGKMYV